MRIISGTLRGRHFDPPADKWPTRPTTDRAREGLYNILMHRLDFSTITMLDLFGGTGSHSFEAISRGCTNVHYVDNYLPCVRFVHQQAKIFGIEEHLKIIRSDVTKFLHRTKENFDFVFAGPPYPLKWLDQIPNLVIDHNLIAPQGLFVLEHDLRNHFEQHPRFVSSRKYGSAIFSFFN